MDYTNLSYLISCGVDPVTVAKRAGHSRVSTTLDIYSYAFNHIDREAANLTANMGKEINTKKTSNNDLDDYKKVKEEMDRLGFKSYDEYYSFSENEDPDGIFMDDENSDDTSMLDATSRDFLEEAIRDYNLMFNTNYDTLGEKFQNYYKDVSKRMKEKQIDILIVVNMFLTGFDAKTLNTLWVDKNLKYHGLLQAFSRTNRIYDKVKSYGSKS